MKSLETNIFKILGIAVTGAVVLGALRSDRAGGAARIIGATGSAVNSITAGFLR